jgi:hypothetical protein
MFNNHTITSDMHSGLVGTKIVETKANGVPILCLVCLKGLHSQIYGGMWYQSIGFSQRERRRDFRWRSAIHSHARHPLRFRATSHKVWDLRGLFPNTVHNSVGGLFYNHELNLVSAIPLSHR